MSPILFWTFVAIMLFFAGMVVLNRNSVASALSLVVSFLALAALYVSSDAYFLGVIQILVYAGAVMVLFLFVIMLLDLKTEERRRFRAVGLIAGLISVGHLLIIFLRCLKLSPPNVSSTPSFDGGTLELGRLLFKEYLLPFEIVSVLLL